MLGATRGGTLDVCPQSVPSTRGSLGKITAEAAELDSQRQWRIMLGSILTDKKEEQNHQELIEIEEAVTDLIQCSDPKPFHNVNEGRKIARKKLPLKKRRSVEADSGSYATIDPKKSNHTPDSRGFSV